VGLSHDSFRISECRLSVYRTVIAVSKQVPASRALILRIVSRYNSTRRQDKRWNTLRTIRPSVPVFRSNCPLLGSYISVNTRRISPDKRRCAHQPNLTSTPRHIPLASAVLTTDRRPLITFADYFPQTAILLSVFEEAGRTGGNWDSDGNSVVPGRPFFAAKRIGDLIPLAPLAPANSLFLTTLPNKLFRIKDSGQMLRSIYSKQTT
jgi:hypothetical protein